ncbi:hypothetical protein Tco_0205745 [Tanacetum coccineum]
MRAGCRRVCMDGGVYGGHETMTEDNGRRRLCTASQFTLSEALAKKQAPFGVSDDMSRTYTSFLLGTNDLLEEDAIDKAILCSSQLLYSE